MSILDVFNNDAFSVLSLSKAVEKMDYVPGLLGSLGVFEETPVATTKVSIEELSTGSSLLQTSKRGAALHQTGGDNRVMRDFPTFRVGDASTIRAEELQNIRLFSSETQVKMLADEIARRQFKLKRNLDLTLENMRLSTVMGALKDADGSTLIAWDTALSQTIPAEVDFDLDNPTPADGALRNACAAAIRSISTGLKGMPMQRVVALCGDTFFDQLMSHPEIANQYLGTSNATWLGQNMVWQSYQFAGITFINYRGTDDGTTLTVGATKAKFFPLGAGIFQWVQAPGESFDDVNVVGQAFYSAIHRDPKRNAYVELEVVTYPLLTCVMPQALYRAKNT